MLVSLKTYSDMGRQAAALMNDGKVQEADGAEQEFKTLCRREAGFHPHFERRCGDSAAAQSAYGIAYSITRR